MILIWLVKFFHVFVLVNNMIFDTHIHLNDEKYTNLDILIKEAKELGINAFLCVGYDLESSKKAIEIASKFDNVFASVGVIPTEHKQYNDGTINELRKLVARMKTILRERELEVKEGN